MNTNNRLYVLIIIKISPWVLGDLYLVVRSAVIKFDKKARVFLFHSNTLVSNKYRLYIEVYELNSVPQNAFTKCSILVMHCVHDRSVDSCWNTKFKI
jgi:hypothetical protein